MSESRVQEVGEGGEPTDPDADPAAPPAPAPLRGAWRGQWPVLGMVALGGGVGAAARYAAAELWPSAADGFPVATLVVNVVGCALIGVFMVVISEVWAAHRLVRPFVGTGVLGGFTTFSTYAADIRHLVQDGRPALGLAYLGLTLVAALAAVWAAAVATRRALRAARRTVHGGSGR
ncbi:fluoride efflux transporter CrcB [Streptomyces boncukensis]|uniref:Fluoride-specific ion channel FluC n=1 Tax=Streptomyces boncukensis TaxID=2711219 RepID=A0A6G4WXC7_9ACTN|nr:fluoride efflux transporter CrcB [Streptomyces boncukensis]NGO69663.1 fluoride efflux transporter CrcB [Streptomyces boncukensis]